MSKNLIALQNHFLGTKQSAYELLSVLQKDQGYISSADIDRLAAEHLLPPQLLRSTADFYDELTPRSSVIRQLQVCNGEACQVAGAGALKQRIVDHFSVDNQQIEIGDVTCLGYCSGGPNLWIDQQVIGAKSEQDANENIDQLLDQYLQTPDQPPAAPTNPCHPVGKARPAVLMPYLLAGDQAAVELYDLLKTTLAERSAEQVLEQIASSQLRGRGGAGFPLAVKLQTVRDSPVQSSTKVPDPIKYLVVNFDEGDAGAYIDKELVERCPALLLSGALLAAYACGAGHIYIYARLEYPLARQLLAEAIESARKAGLVDTDIGHSDFSCEITLISGQGAYICGEETSLLRSIEGLPAVVSIRPPYPAVQGLWGQPTAVCNVETLCNVPWIIDQGGERYAALGHDQSRGTKLVSLNRRVKRPGLYEVELGTTLREIIFDLAGGMAEGETFKAVQIGGPLGGLLPESALDTPLDFEQLPKVGGLLGHGGMVVYSQRDDLAAIARGTMAFCAKESCGKCFPCRIGSVRATELLDQIHTDGATSERIELLEDICETMKTGSLCAMGSMTPAAVESVISHFPAELGLPAVFELENR